MVRAGTRGRGAGAACGARGLGARGGGGAGLGGRGVLNCNLCNDAPLPEFWRARAAAASSEEMVEASTPPLFLSSSAKESSVDSGLTYTT